MNRCARSLFWFGDKRETVCQCPVPGCLLDHDLGIGKGFPHLSKVLRRLGLVNISITEGRNDRLDVPESSWRSFRPLPYPTLDQLRKPALQAFLWPSINEISQSPLFPSKRK